MGEDLGIHPNLLRLTFAALLFWNPLTAFATYAVTGLLVLTMRLVFPVPARPVADQPEAASGKAAPIEEKEQLPLAA